MKPIYKKTFWGAGILALVLLVTAAAKSDFKMGRDMEILFNLFREINLLYVDEVDADQLLLNAATGMTSELDPYTEYMPEEEMADFEFMTTGKYAGIGSLVRQDGDYVVISQPYRGFPADKAGLEVGDRFVEIDGQDAKGMTTAQVSSKLRGEVGTTIKIKIQKFYTGQTEAITLKRERIAISGVPYHGFVEDGIGYIRHEDFSEDCGNDMRKALDDLRRQGSLKGLIIDLRGNGGGILQEAVKILSFFVPKGTEVVSMRGKVKELDAVFKTENQPVDTLTPIVVLVNSGSASASEIVAGSLQDLDRAVLMGQRSFGKGLVQTTRPLGYNSFLKITTAKYYIPSGRCIQAIDYAHRNEDGSVSYVPDSLVKEFHTRAGRLVYDGGGVMPEVKMDAEYPSRFVYITYARGYIEDFVDEYMRSRQLLDVPVRGFALPSDAYPEFIAFMKDKNVDFQSETLEALKTLRKKAEQERYLDKISAELDRIERDLPDDKQENLELYKKDISALIANEIVMRRHYIQGVIESNMASDKEVNQAVALLKDTARYKNLLSAPK